MSLTIDGDAGTVIAGTINGRLIAMTLGELANGSVTGHIGPFLAPAYHFGRPVSRADSHCDFAWTERASGEARDWYSVRVRQRNEQWAWSSPIWVEARDR